MASDQQQTQEQPDDREQLHVKRYTELVAKAWTDPTFKQRLLADPVATLRGEGAAVEDGVTIRILEPGERKLFITLADDIPARGTRTPAGEQDPFSHLVARARTDAAYKARLVSEPVAVLAEAGLEVPAGVDVEVVEASDTQGFLLLLPAPEDVERGNSDDVAGYWGAEYHRIIYQYVRKGQNPLIAGVTNAGNQIGGSLGALSSGGLFSSLIHWR
jgi:hypothetical protein